MVSLLLSLNFKLGSLLLIFLACSGHFPGGVRDDLPVLMSFASSIFMPKKRFAERLTETIDDC